MFRYSNIDEMWKVELNEQNTGIKNQIGSKENWYNKAAEYWEVWLLINYI